MRWNILVTLLVAATALAGCSDETPDQPTPGVTDTTGIIRGVVVDETITPVEGAKLRLQTGEETVSAEDGTFRFEDLEPGDYFVTAQKPGYEGTQVSTKVVAGMAEPPSIRVQIIFVPGAQPYMETYQMRGFYECAFGAPVITDSCDFGYRTGHDVASNESGERPPAPRNLQQFHNTEYYDIAPSVMSIIQEGVWDDPQVSEMKISLDQTPIDPGCDCSPSYVEVDQASPTYARLDGERVPGGETAAARGFLPFGDPQVATNFEFSIFTTFFHNVEAPEGWSFVNGDPKPF